jgi:hypothetical protein
MRSFVVGEQDTHSGAEVKLMPLRTSGPNGSPKDQPYGTGCLTVTRIVHRASSLRRRRTADHAHSPQRVRRTSANQRGTIRGHECVALRHRRVEPWSARISIALVMRRSGVRFPKAAPV